MQIFKWFPRLAFWLWVPAVLIPGAYLMAGHLLTLPKPDALDPQLVHALANTRTSVERNRWMVRHVLYSGCKCSGKVLSHLLERRAASDWVEKIVFISDDPLEQNSATPAQATAAGFEFESITREQLKERYRMEAAPVMVVSDPNDTVLYLGGYTDRKQSSAINDVAMMQRTRRGEHVPALPLFGCAVSRELQSAVDPLGLRK